MSRPARALLLALGFAAACGPAARSAAGGPAAAPPAPGDAPGGRQADPRPRWLDGAWRGEAGDLHVVPAGDAQFIIRFAPGGGWDVLLLAVDDETKVLMLTLWPGGGDPQRWRIAEESGERLVFVSAAEPPGPAIELRREGGALHAKHGDAAMRFALVDAAPAPELVRADVDFAAETLARGAAGWGAWFLADGIMARTDGRTVGRAAIEERMKPLFDSGMRIDWHATASAWAPAGDQTLGFSVGESTFTPKTGAGFNGAYVTIWRQDADGRHRVAFDTGDTY